MVPHTPPDNDPSTLEAAPPPLVPPTMPPTATGTDASAASSSQGRRPSFDFTIHKGKPEISAAHPASMPSAGAIAEEGEDGRATPPNEVATNGTRSAHEKVQHFFGE